MDHRIAPLPAQPGSPERTLAWTPIDDPAGPAVGFLTHSHRRDTCVYRVEEFPASEGRGFYLARLLPGTDRTECGYFVLCRVVAGRREVTCECKGYARWSRCRHVESVAKCLDEGWL